MEEKKLTKQQIKAMESRRKLLESAGELFSKRLIEDVGVREICANAGVTTGTFYHYFDSKDDILDKVYVHRDSQFGEVLAALLDKPPYRDRVVEFFSMTMADTVKRDGVDFTMHRMFKMRKKSTGKSSLFIGLTAVIEKGQETGEFSKQLDASEINQWLWVLFRGTVYDWCLDEEDIRGSLNEKIERAMNLFLDGVGK